jgi:cutinase
MCHSWWVNLRRVVVAIGAVGAVVWAAQMAPLPSARAAGCPDVEVVFARGTTEAPGVGPAGDTFVNSLRSRIGAKSVNVYGVDYPATTAFSTAIEGITDARAHILATAANCPQTKMVLGGFSQGAAVMGFVTDSVVPEGISPADVPAPMPPETADHVAAVVLFGKPSTRFMRAINDPPVTIGPLYIAKTTDLCVENDLVCDPHGNSFAAHNQYIDNGTVDEGAAFAATQLQASWAAAGQSPGATPSVPPPADLVASPHLPSAPLTAPGPQDEARSVGPAA